MNVNFGLMPPLDGRYRKADRKKAYTDRARMRFAEWLQVSADAVDARVDAAAPAIVE
jgi:methylenetetrahydrofolate--tRNA-(uracil-5-)-methyltransferase